MNRIAAPVFMGVLLHKHNLDLLAASHQHKGQMKLAEKLQREATAVTVGCH